MSALSASLNLFYVTSSNAAYFFNTSSNTGYDKFKYLISLKNTINWYRANSEYYKFEENISSSVTSQNGSLVINIPSLFYGSSLKRGSVELDFYYTGTLIGKLQDYKYNGELVQTLPSGSNNSGSTAGIVLYNEGIIILTGSWSLSDTITDSYMYESHSNNIGLGAEQTDYDKPRWIHWGKSFINSSSLDSSSFGFNFEGKNKTPSLTMFAHANKNHFNTSNNPSYVKYYSNSAPYSSSNVYVENNTIDVKNTVYEPYDNYTGSFEKQTFINKIGIYDEERNLIGVVKLATPIKKTNDRDITFKIKVDL